MSKGVEVDERVLMRSALDDATHDLEFGRPLPAYLRAALLKFQKTQVKQRTTALLLPKLVERHARAGAPKSNATAAETAFEKAAVDVGVSPKTAQRAHRRFPPERDRSEEHTSELQSLMRISYAVFCLTKKRIHIFNTILTDHET